MKLPTQWLNKLPHLVSIGMHQFTLQAHRLRDSDAASWLLIYSLSAPSVGMSIYLLRALNYFPI